MLGARVLTLDQVYGVKDPSIECWGTEEEDGGDPPRLWAPNGNYPGTAFTRSIGDNGRQQSVDALGQCSLSYIMFQPATPLHEAKALTTCNICEVDAEHTFLVASVTCIAMPVPCIYWLYTSCRCMHHSTVHLV